MIDAATVPAAEAERKALIATLAPFQAPSVRRSVGQFALTAAGYIAVLATMYASYGVSVWLTLALAIPAGGFVVRLFIIQHDCGHASFFRSHRANALTGWLCSLATYTPYSNWRRQHAGHHAVWNNLDHRHGGADIYSSCITVREYEALSPVKRRLYRATRHPLIAQLLLPPLVFLVIYRFPFDTPRTWTRERRGVWLTNLAIAASLGLAALCFGFGAVAVVQLPIIVVASITGVWLFSVQHRFEESLWTRQETWSHANAAQHGSSWLRLPRVLQWFTGNIGFHHIHHLLPRVPNYRLEECHGAAPGFVGSVTTLSMRQAFAAPTFALWDEERGRMVRFPG